jgi:glucose-6-phosphate 1-dehydrogenase
VPLDLGLANAFAEYRRRIAYERLLLDLIEGDPTLFVRRDEVEAQWAWIDQIRPAGRRPALRLGLCGRAPGARRRRSR